jgi:hypothetical protein
VVDGNSLADRLPLQLASNSVIVKQDSPHIEFWYDDLVPWRHYIPVKRDLSDLEETLVAVLANDTLMQEVVEAANDYVLRFLAPDRVKCYWAQLLHLLSRRPSFSLIFPSHFSESLFVLSLYLNLVSPCCLQFSTLSNFLAAS